MARSFLCAGGAAHLRTTKERTGKTRINNVHYWLSVMLPWEGDFAWSFEARFGERASSGNERQCRSCSLRVGFFWMFERRNDEKLEKVAVPLKRNHYTLRNFYKRN